MRFPYGFWAAVDRPGGRDRHGFPLPGEEPHTIGRCARDQVKTTEFVDGQATVITEERLLIDDPDADVKSIDVLVLPNGERWQVNGDPDRPINPFTGWRPGTIVSLTRAAG